MLERLERRSLLAFSDLATIADSLRLAEDSLPQVPGTDASLAQMLPARLSAILALDAYGNGQTTWSSFDTQFPSPTVADVQAVANTIVSGAAFSPVALPTVASSSGTVSPGNALQRSAGQQAESRGHRVLRYSGVYDCP